MNDPTDDNLETQNNSDIKDSTQRDPRSRTSRAREINDDNSVPNKLLKLITLRRDGVCALCSTPILKGTKANWAADTRTVTCTNCPCEVAREDVSMKSQSIAVMSEALDLGSAGLSARKEYDHRHRNREEALDKTFGKLAGVVKFFSDDPMSTTTWAKGASGEERVARFLEREVGTAATFLHDRKVPGTKGNIDNIAVSNSGIWIIDSKNYTGKVENRDVGGLFIIDQRL